VKLPKGILLKDWTGMSSRNALKKSFSRPYTKKYIFAADFS
jgi:hypothetical protein